MTVRVSAVVCLFAALSLLAQEQRPAEIPLPPVPELEGMTPEMPAEPVVPSHSGRELQVFERKSDRVQSDVTLQGDGVIGSNGELLLGPSDVQLRVFSGPMRFLTNENVERMRIMPDTGNVGIGYSAPDRKLYVQSTGANGAALVLQNSAYSTNGTASDVGMYGVMYSTVVPGVTQSGNAHAFRGVTRLFDTGTLNYAYGLSAEVAVGSGAAHTGTIQKAFGLHVAVNNNDGTIVNGYGVYISNLKATNDFGVFQEGADDDNYFAGRVGIGTSSPADMLNLSAASNTAVRLTHTDPASALNAMTFYEGASLYGFINQRGSAHATEPRQFNIGNNNPSGNTAFWAGGSRRMTLYSNGSVGIGTTAAPVEKLYVVGDVRVTGAITGGTVIGAVYQDLAEWVPASVDMEPGTVVVLNHDRTNEVMPSHTSYDTSVAGVVSAQPGVLLGVAGDSKEQIATTGRVKVRVDATRAPIRVGDLLVTSDISGTAMRSEPIDINGRRFHQPGTIIGKALEPLESGTGEILVLLSMQ